MEISLEISQTIPQNSIENDLKDPVIPLKSLKRPGYDELLTITEACKAEGFPLLLKFSS